QDQGKAKGLAACNSQAASPFGCLNNFYFRILSNFLGSLQLYAGAFLLSKFAIRSLQTSENPLYYTKHGSPKFFLRCAAKQLFRSEHKASPRVSRKWIEVYSADRFCAFCASCIFGREHFCFACFIKTGGVLCRHA
ncbi:hypothetical protein, partial [Hominenteromicrobium sp.]|uniref:hypothetical protein n=1 Tax=Hominenteromicrobium sp. TaxID=3073581 RepID=UPI003AF15CA0